MTSENGKPEDSNKKNDGREEESVMDSFDGKKRDPEKLPPPENRGQEQARASQSLPVPSGKPASEEDVQDAEWTDKAENTSSEGEVNYWNLFWDTFTRRYSAFAGRASRTEFWTFVIGGFIGSALIGAAATMPVVGFFAGVLSIGWSIALIIPSVAAVIRRLHDTGRSGWWAMVPVIFIFLPLILLSFTGLLLVMPLMSLVWLYCFWPLLMLCEVPVLVFCLFPGEERENRWGAVPEL